MNLRVIGVLFGLIGAWQASAQVVWSEASTLTRPPARMNAAMADGPADSSVLFGGSDRLGIAFDDTWIRDRGANDWVLMTVGVRPPTRERHAMAFHELRQEVVLFGGRSSAGLGQPPVYRGDTWVWNGSAWQQVVGAPAPTARAGHAMAYDASRGVVVLFGGQDANGTQLGDTWEFSGLQWRNVPPPGPTGWPAPRSAHAMAYVGRLPPRVVLFGGHDGSADRSDTWEWDGVDWQQRSPAVAPSARWSFAMVHDAARRRAILFGGAQTVFPFGVRALADTWEWDGAAWVESSHAVHPTARYGHAMCFDAYRHSSGLEPEVVMCGGNAGSIIDPRDDTWLGEVWRLASFTEFGVGCAGSSMPLSLTDIDVSVPWIGEPLQMAITPLPVSAGASGVAVLGASNTAWGGNALPMPLSGPPLFLGPTCSLYVSVDVTWPITGSPVATWSLPIPDDPNLVGLALYVQAFGIDAGAVGGLIVSNAATLVLGMRQ